MSHILRINVRWDYHLLLKEWPCIFAANKGREEGNIEIYQPILSIWTISSAYKNQRRPSSSVHLVVLGKVGLWKEKGKKCLWRCWTRPSPASTACLRNSEKKHPRIRPISSSSWPTKTLPLLSAGVLVFYSSIIIYTLISVSCQTG